MCGVGPAASVATSAALMCSGSRARIRSSSTCPIEIERRTLRFSGRGGAGTPVGTVAQPAAKSASTANNRFLDVPGRRQFIGFSGLASSIDRTQV